VNLRFCAQPGHRQRGASATEYAVLVAVLAVVVFAAGRAMGLQLPALFSTSAEVAGSAIAGSPGRSATAPGQTGTAPGLVGNTNAASASNAAGNASASGISNSGGSNVGNTK